MKTVTPIWETAREILRDGALDRIAEIETVIRDPATPKTMKTALEAQLLYFRGETKEAKTMLEAAAATRKLSAEEGLVLGHLLLDVGEIAKAFDLLEAARTMGLDDPRVEAGLGTVAMHRDDPAEAIACFEAALERDPAHWHARYLLGLAYAGLNKASRARGQFERVIAEHPKFEPAWLGFAAASVACGLLDATILTFEKAMKLFPESPPIAIAFADLLRRTGNSRHAVGVLVPLASRSQDPEFLLEFVELCLRGDRVDVALEALKVVDHLDPKSVRGRVLRGHILEMVKPRQIEAAAASYRSALEIEPNDVRAKNALGLLLMRDTSIKDWTEASALLESACAAVEPAPLAPLMNLAILRISEGRKDDAKRLAEEVLQRRNASTQVKNQARQVIADATAK